jgi:hypothetical protein
LIDAQGNLASSGSLASVEKSEGSGDSHFGPAKIGDKGTRYVGRFYQVQDGLVG